MPLSFTPLTNNNLRASQDVFTGIEGDLYFVFGGLAPAIGARLPTHTLSPQGKSASANLVSAKFSGGITALAAVQWVKTILVTNETNLVDGTSTLTVGPTTYTFRTTPTLATEIEIGTSPADCATNIAARLTLDLGTLGVASAVAVGSLVTITGNVSGANFALSSNAPTALTLATTVTGNAAVTGVAASATVRCTGAKKVAGTRNTLFMNLKDSLNRTFRAAFVYPTAIDNESDNAVVTGLKDVLTEAINGTTTFDALTPNGGRFFVNDNTDITSENLQDVLIDLFGTASNFTVSGDTLTLTLATNGEEGNNYGLTTEIGNSPGSIINIAENGVPIVDAEVYFVGPQVNFVVNQTTTVVELQASNFRATYARINQSSDVSASFTGQFDNVLRLQQLANDSSKITFDDFREILYPGGNPISQLFGVIYVMKSKRVTGAYDVVVLYTAQAQSSPINLDLRANAGMTFNLSLFAQRSAGDPFGYYYQTQRIEAV
jgi:hypothetical protein